MAGEPTEVTSFNDWVWTIHVVACWKKVGVEDEIPLDTGCCITATEGVRALVEVTTSRESGQEGSDPFQKLNYVGWYGVEEDDPVYDRGYSFLSTLDALVTSQVRSQDKARHDTTRHDKTRLDRRARQDKTRQDRARQDKTRQDTTRQDKTRQNKTRRDTARQDKTRQDKILIYTQLSRFENACILLSIPHINSGTLSYPYPKH